MTKYIKNKDGKFAGSIGDGKDAVPTVAPKVAKAPKITKTQQARIDYENRMREMRERHAAMLPEILARRERQEAARQSWFSISESVNSSYPEARWMILDDNRELLRLTDRDGNTVVDGETVMKGKPELKDTMGVFAQHEDLVNGRYKKDEGGHRVGIFYLCGEDGCTHRFYPEGFQPGHTASVRCMSGRRPHCTCDTCF